MENKQWQFSLWYILMFFWIILLFQNFFFASHPVDIAYSDFIKLLKADKLDNVLLSEDYITANLKPDGLTELLPEDKLKEIKEYGGKEPQISTVRINDPSLVSVLEAAKVKFNGQAENKWLTMVLSWIIPALLFFALWSFLIRRMGSAAGGVLDVGKSKAKIYMEKETHVSFQDVAGVDEAKAELMEVVEFLKNPQHYTRIGAHIPKGVLLVGPPGTGKTLLARAVAGEAGVPFFSINGSEFVEMFVGVGAARVRDLFIHARETAPAIIFIDELDALGRARGAYPLGGGHDEKEQTLNQLLSEMDGFDPSEGLILLAATNRPEILDPALLRAGRFDRHVLVDRPDKKGRIDILNVHLKKIKKASDVDPEKIAALTPGFSGADLANLVNEAALLATRHDADSVSMDDFTNAVERIVAGLEKKNRLLNPEERKAVAYHEMGHTLIALSLPNVDQVHKVSIIPRGIGSLGYTIQRPTEDRYLMTEQELKNKMMVLLGGRAAEFVVFGRFSTGAADDLAKATDIARSMVMRYGMDKELGPVTYQKEHSPFLESPMTYHDREFSEETACEIDTAVRKIIQNVFDDAVDIIKKHIKILDKGATLLLKKETLNEEDLATLHIK
ncbi:ATP-dependent zinc metalloprotease FtsH [Fluoribacter gormanii]|uniref:ATP-dependent zinc metalloprotease FtsH n=1 Tax=Fluoribacter gormanii TaxID=464 RepID=A0A377GI18_9GAMM|nr:ATP-dependent zinc metalloprotease FtsH [Fluoribacter gormanii]KTD02269.1 protease, ATP-dependent zinc-metallo [Fluoribacter gormanii]SIR27256.1 membrane protease FtsH catalytic subunit [Fluoribacter gormanii]STO24022.1 ATP-dependent zinc metalloprotease FtsH [Fluoribacter gormanii]